MASGVCIGLSITPGAAGGGAAVIAVGIAIGKVRVSKAARSGYTSFYTLMRIARTSWSRRILCMGES